MLEADIRRLRSACKVIYEFADYLTMIKEAIRQDDIQEASALWNEIDYPVQKLLYIAPTKGGIFTTEERAVIKSIWEISVSDVERK